MSPAADQLPRLLRLIPLATRAEGVAVDEAADELGITVERLLEDVQVLTDRSFYLPGGSTDDLQVHLDGERLRIFSPGAFTRPLRLSPGELLALSIALRFAGVTEPEHRELCERVERELGRREGGETADLPAALPDLRKDPERVRDRLSRAVLERRRVEFDYLKPGADAPELRTLEPWRLLHGEGEWYVVGHDPGRDGPRLFRVDRVLAVRLTHTRFEPDPDWDPGEIIRDGQVMLNAPGTEPRTVAVRYSPAVARRVRERWAGEDDPEGGYLVEHTVFEDGWLTRHVLRYGGEAATG